MKLTRLLPTTLLVLTLAALLLLDQRHREVSHRLDAAHREIVSLQTALAAAQTTALLARRQPDSQAQSLPPTSDGGSSARRWPPAAERVTIPLGTEDLNRLQRVQAVHERAALDRRFAALFRQLNLDPDKLARLKNLLVERELSTSDAYVAASEQGIDLQRDSRSAEQAVAAATAEVERAIAELLGGEAYAAYSRYRDSLPHRGTVEQLEQRLSYTPTPLSESQSAALLQIFAATANDARPPSGRGDAVLVTPSGALPFAGPPITDAAVAQAQGVLDGAQLAALRELQQTQRAQQEALSRISPSELPTRALPAPRR